MRAPVQPSDSEWRPTDAYDKAVEENTSVFFCEKAGGWRWCDETWAVSRQIYNSQKEAAAAQMQYCIHELGL